jgi:hypothetical protein
MNSYAEKLFLLGVLGFFPGQKITEEGKVNMKSLCLWAWGTGGTQGKSPLNLHNNRIRQYIRFVGPSKCREKLTHRKAS